MHPVKKEYVAVVMHEYILHDPHSACHLLHQLPATVVVPDPMTMDCPCLLG